MDDAAYLKLVSRRVYVWAMQTQQPFPMSRVKDAFMQVTQVQLERALEVLVSEAKVKRLDGRRLCSFEVLKYLEEFDPCKKTAKSALRELPVNVKKRPAPSAKSGKKLKAPKAVPATSSLSSVSPEEESPPVEESKRAEAPVEASLLELCQEVMARFDGQVTGAGDEAPVPESEFFSRAAAAGYGEDSVERVLSMWDDRCRVLRCVESGVRVLYRV